MKENTIKIQQQHVTWKEVTEVKTMEKVIFFEMRMKSDLYFVH